MIVVKEVLNKTDFKNFIKFPYQLYRNVNYYVPKFFDNETYIFSPEKNTSYGFSEARLFLAYDGEKIVGRIATIINHRYNMEHNCKELRFSRFDVIDNLDVTRALFDIVKSIAIENELDTIIGEMGFNEFEHFGLLTDGYESYGLYNDIYNYPYYIKHLEVLGFVKDESWSIYRYSVPEVLDSRYDDITKFVFRKYNLKFAPVSELNKEELKDILFKSMMLRSKKYDYRYAFTNMTDKEMMDKTIQYIEFVQNIIIDINFVSAIVNNDNDVVAFSLAIPSLAKILAKINGLSTVNYKHLYSKGYLKSDSVDLFSIVVSNEYQNQGLSLILQNQILKACKNRDIKYINTSFDFDLCDNLKLDWNNLEFNKNKTFTSYKYKLGE